MTPFRISLRSGVPISEQIVFAAKRAIYSGQMQAGEAFPSVRALSKDLRINPNTAHRAVGELIRAGLLETLPGIGTVVAQPPVAAGPERAALLTQQVEELVVEARRLGIAEPDLQRALSRAYELLTPGERTR